MLGAISGDTIGSVYEFHNTKDYNFVLFSEHGSYTDDTVMTMAVARWLLSDPAHTYQGLEDSMLLLADTFPCPMGGYGGSFDNWLFRPDLLRLYGQVSAAITHNHPEGIKGAQATAAAIFLARTGKSKEEIREYIGNTYGYDLHKTWEYWHPIYDWEDSCQGNVPQALIAFLDSSDFEDAVRKAVSLGGDSDTLACITGGIAEAFYGGMPEQIAEKALENLPQDFIGIIREVMRKTAYGGLYGPDAFR